MTRGGSVDRDTVRDSRPPLVLSLTRTTNDFFCLWRLYLLSLVVVTKCMMFLQVPRSFKMVDFRKGQVPVRETGAPSKGLSSRSW